MQKKKYQIKYLKKFDEDLNEILYYITYKLNNKNAAKNILDKIEKSIIDRSYNPESFEVYITKENREFKWYRIYVNNYIILYTVKDNEMIVTRLLYKRRNIKAIF